MEYINYSINEIGKQEILEFLRENHKKSVEDKDFFNNESMLNAWSADAEFQLGEGNPAMIEIRSWDSVWGRTQTFRISDAGVDKEVIVENDE